jgi:putative FmdB family regulatory protein
VPIFEYQCRKCGHVTEVLEKAGAKGKHTCIKCGSSEMVKLLSAFGVGKGGASSSSGSCPTGTCSLTQ